MHELNFCQNLCLPKSVGEHKSRGYDPVMTFKEGFVVPMAAPCAELHALYSVKPVLVDPVAGASRFASRLELSSQEFIEEHKRSKDRQVVAPDHCADPDPRADIVFETLDESLRTITEGLFSSGYSRVAIWSNNGIGETATPLTDGVLRDKSGLANAVKVNHKEHDHYVKGALKDSYQNSAHLHIHIAPVSIIHSDLGFDKTLESALRAIHESSNKSTLKERRKFLREDASCVPFISYAVLDSAKTDLDKEIEFEHFEGRNCFTFNGGLTMSGFVRKLLVGYHKLTYNKDLTNPVEKKRLTDSTRLAYSMF